MFDSRMPNGITSAELAAEIMTDKKGDDWILYHAYIRDKAKQGRVVMLDRIHWKKGWPYVEGNMPSNEAQAPKF